MALKDQISLFLRWPVIKALPNRIRRIFSADSGQRKLQMPVLETERLVLRQLDQHDLRDIIAWEEVTWAQNTDGGSAGISRLLLSGVPGAGHRPMGNSIEANRGDCGQLWFPSHHFQEPLWRGQLLHCFPASWARAGLRGAAGPLSMGISGDRADSNPSPLRTGQFEFPTFDAESGDEVRRMDRERSVFERPRSQTKTLCDPGKGFQFRTTTRIDACAPNMTARSDGQRS